MIWGLCWSCAVLIANRNYCWKRRIERERTRKRVGGNAISCGFSLRSVALYQAAAVADIAAEEEIVVFGECRTSIQLTGIWRVPTLLRVLLGVAWCIHIVAALTITITDHHKSRWICLNDSRVKLNHECSLSVSSCPLAPEALCVLWAVTVSYWWARGSAVLFRGQWPLHWPLTPHPCTGLHC